MVASAQPVFMVSFAAIIPALLLYFAAQWHWVLGLLVACALAVALLLLLDYLQFKLASRGGGTSLGLMVAGLAAAVFLALLVCAGLSNVLSSINCAVYASAKPLHQGRFVDYYLWHLLDMIPGIDLWNNLKVAPPAKALNGWAGFPLVLFKLIVLCGIIRVIRQWLEYPREKQEPTG